MNKSDNFEDTVKEMKLNDLISYGRKHKNLIFKLNKRYEIIRAMLNARIDEGKHNGEHKFLNIPDDLALSVVAIKNYLHSRYPEAVLTNIDPEKRIITYFIPAKYQRWSEKYDWGKVDRRIQRGTTTLDLELLKILDEDLFEQVTTTEIVVDEKAVAHLLKTDPAAKITIESAITSKSPQSSIVFTESKEKE